MSRTLLKLLMLISVVASSTSSASAWTTNGPFNFTMTTGALRIQANPGPPLNCSGPNNIVSSLKARSGALSGIALAADLQMHWNGCSVSGLAFTITCTPSTNLNGVSYSGNTTSGTISNIHCVLVMPNCTVTMTGTLNVTYSNATFALTLLSLGQSLSYSATGSCAALGYAPNGTYTWTNATGGNAVYTVTSSPKPQITHP
jgi:hypothetical protein